MVRRGKRGHATLPRPFGPPGPPFSPTAGYVYRIRTLLYSSIDPAAERPVVVLAVPELETARIQVVTNNGQRYYSRCSPSREPGALGLDQDGVFCNLVSVGPHDVVSTGRATVRPLGRSLLAGRLGSVLLMTPREEICAKQRIGPAGAALLYQFVYAVAVARNFPPPPGFQQWDESAVTETAHDFLDGERGRRRMTDIALRSVDEPSFERILETAVLNFLRDISRRTDMGRLVVRVKDVLSEDPAFRSVAQDRWALADGPAEPSTQPEPVLSASIAGAEVSIPQWNSARRAAPVADRASLVRLLLTVLTAAQGSLTRPTLLARLPPGSITAGRR